MISDTPATDNPLADALLSPAANQALDDYLRLGPGRTLNALLERYLLLEAAPTRSHGTLRHWSSQYDWPARALEFDRAEKKRLRAEADARREALLERGLALEYERIDHLTALFDKLNTLVADDDVFWIRNVRLLRYPDGTTERVELRRFNGALVHQLRGLLDDIALETGGRPPRLPVQPLPDNSYDDPLKWEQVTLKVFTPEEKAEFLRLQDKLFYPVDNPEN